MNQAKTDVPHKRNHEYFTRLIEKHRNRLTHAVIAMTGERYLQIMEDIVQETHAIAWKKFDQLHDERNFCAWAIKIASSVYMDRLKTWAHESEHLKGYYEERKPSILDRDEYQTPENHAMNNERKRLIQEALDTLPIESRIVYAYRYADEMSISQIAETLGISKRTVEDRLKKARQLLALKIHQMAKDYLTEQFREADQDESHCPWLLAIANFKLMTASSQETEISPTAPQLLETVGERAAEVTTVGAGMAASAWSFSTILMAAAMPFAWVMSFLIGWQLCGLAFVRNAPTLQIRRWLVQQFFYGYCLLIFLPAILVPACYLLDCGTGMKMRHNVIIPLMLLGMVLIPLTGVAYIVKANGKYFRLAKIREDAPLTLSYRSLKNLITYGFGGITIVLIVMLILFAWSALLPNFQQEGILPSSERIIFMWGTFGILLTLFLLFHFSTLFLFRYCLSISKDETTFQIASLVSQPVDWIRFRKIIEILCFLIVIIISSLPNINHLFLRNIRPVCSSVELVTFFLMWCLVFRWNRKTTSFKKWCAVIIGTAVFQMGVMVFLRIVVY